MKKSIKRMVVFLFVLCTITSLTYGSTRMYCGNESRMTNWEVRNYRVKLVPYSTTPMYCSNCHGKYIFYTRYVYPEYYCDTCGSHVTGGRQWTGIYCSNCGDY